MSRYSNNCKIWFKDWEMWTAAAFGDASPDLKT